MANVALISLQRYFLWADQMKTQAEERRVGDLDYELRAHWQPFRAYWYGGLYAVVEGWEKLGFSDAQIEQLLADRGRVKLLKQYRNGAFHYQAKYFDSRFVDLWSDRDAIFWIRELHSALRRWLREQPETRDTP